MPYDCVRQSDRAVRASLDHRRTGLLEVGASKAPELDACVLPVLQREDDTQPATEGEAEAPQQLLRSRPIPSCSAVAQPLDSRPQRPSPEITLQRIPSLSARLDRQFAEGLDAVDVPSFAGKYRIEARMTVGDLGCVSGDDPCGLEQPLVLPVGSGLAATEEVEASDFLEIVRCSGELVLCSGPKVVGGSSWLRVVICTRFEEHGVGGNGAKHPFIVEPLRLHERV